MPFFTTNDGTQLHFSDEGGGQPILFVHGYTGSADDWSAQRAGLRDRYRCIAIDRRWHGRSEQTQGSQGMASQAFQRRAPDQKTLHHSW